jgi:hypothetical protein
MKERILKTVLFIMGLIVLQQGIAFSSNQFIQLNEQTAIIESNDIDPSAIFYTDSKLALAAEKSVRRRLN